MSEEQTEALSLDLHPEAARWARTFVDHATRHVDMSDEARYDLRLLASELVTNAVVHAGTPLELSVTVNDCVRVMVRDVGGGEPRITAREIGGWGLRFVEQRSTKWGVLPAEPGKIVWFDFPLR